MRRSRRPDRLQSLNSMDSVQYPGVSGMGEAYRSPVGGGPHELAVVAHVPVRHEVVAERQRGQRVRPLPGRAERRRPAVAAVDAEQLVRVLEAAVAEPAQDDVAAAAQDGEVDVPVAVDVERVGAGDRRQVGDRRRLPREAERTADRALVPVERGRLAAAGEEQLVAPVVVAVERRHATADEELELAVVRVVDARRARLVHEPRGRGGRRPHRLLSLAGSTSAMPTATPSATTSAPSTHHRDRQSLERGGPSLAACGRLVGHGRIEPQRTGHP